MVKIEDGTWLVDTVKMLTERAVPVCGHLRLTPQSVNIFGGYKVQSCGDAGDQLLSDALALKAVSAQLLVLECVPVEPAKRVTQALSIPLSVSAQVMSPTGSSSSCMTPSALPAGIPLNLQKISSLNRTTYALQYGSIWLKSRPAFIW